MKTRILQLPFLVFLPLLSKFPTKIIINKPILLKTETYKR